MAMLFMPGVAKSHVVKAAIGASAVYLVLNIAFLALECMTNPVQGGR